jgi:hypothetical protein
MLYLRNNNIAKIINLWLPKLVLLKGILGSFNIACLSVIGISIYI